MIDKIFVITGIAIIGIFCLGIVGSFLVETIKDIVKELKGDK